MSAANEAAEPYRIVVTKRQLKGLARKLDDLFLAMNKGSEAAFKAIRRRVTQQQRAPDGRRIAPNRVRVEKKREPWIKQAEGEGNPKDGRKKRGLTTPVPIFQYIREHGGVIRRLGAYKFDRLKGGEPLRYDARWTVRAERGTIWGYWWPSEAAFLSANGAGKPTFRTGKAWRAMKLGIIPPRGGQPGQIVIGFKGRRANERPAHLLAMDMNTARTAGGRPRKASTAEIMALMNSRDAAGHVGRQPRGGKPGESLPMSDVPDGAAVRWMDLSDAEMRDTLLDSLAEAFAGKWRTAAVEIREYRGD